MSKIKGLFSLLFIAVLFGGCGSSQPIPTDLQGRVYTQHNLWYYKGKSSSANYKRGTLLPVNTPVQIRKMNRKYIYITLPDKRNQKIIIVNHIKHSKLDSNALAKRYFNRNRVDLSKFTEAEQQGIRTGSIVNNMSKGAVIIARGYFLPRYTPNENMNLWVYPNREKIYFKDGISVPPQVQAASSRQGFAPRTAAAPTPHASLASQYAQIKRMDYNFVKAKKKNYDSFVLAIGINKYADATPVEYADVSAMAFADLAETTLGVPKENIITLYNDEATSGQLKSKIELIKELADKNGDIYIYFAGHGVPGKDGASYMLPQDMTADAIHLEPNLKLENIYKKLNTAKAKNVFVFMDSCFSGRDDKGALLYQGVAPVLRTKKTSLTGKKITVMTAGQSTDFANDHKKKKQRMFSYYLIKELSDGSRDLNKAYSNVRNKVKRASLMKGLGYKQVPQIYGNTASPLY